jgi:hypothetical protein
MSVIVTGRTRMVTERTGDHRPSPNLRRPPANGNELTSLRRFIRRLTAYADGWLAVSHT